jgi:hypothetical protein
MASRSHAWFDAEKLFPGEELIRAVPARARTEAPPFWWTGDLVLTSDRIFFLPDVDRPSLPRIAFWLRELTTAEPAGWNRLHLRSRHDAAMFLLLDKGPRALAGRATDLWLRLITVHCRSSRHPGSIETERRPRRAAG